MESVLLTFANNHDLILDWIASLLWWWTVMLRRLKRSAYSVRLFL